MTESIHISVMAEEIVDYLAPQEGQCFVDGTLGGGGHTRRLAELVGTSGRIIAFDRDIQAVERAEREMANLPVLAHHANFCDIPEVLQGMEISAVDGIVLDLGLSSDQLADDDRGFSFHSEGPLDLRFDTTRGEPAWKLIARMSEKHLADLIFEYGEERHSRRVARALVAARQQATLSSARDIADVVRRSIPGPRQKIDGATRSFQAFRIAVNEELKSLEIALRRLPACMHIGARLAVISFHSLEDRRAKDAFRENPSFAIITRKPIRPSEEEVHRNPRSRSARLRVAERIE